jgi:putative tryptophan/tyrosine transport system ATP-binding protein
MSTTPILEIENLTVVYNANTPYEVIALKKFSLKVEKGEIIVITGGNGSGKSTLLQAICGTVPIKTGKILINGIDITKWSANKRARFIGSVHQDTMLGTCPNLTIQENFQLTNTKRWWFPLPYNLKLNGKQLENLKNIGLQLEKRGTSKINMLSGGQRQAIAVCLAFESMKPILLFDEFTSALDENTARNVLNLTFYNAKKNEATLFMILHNVTCIDKYNLKILNLDKLKSYEQKF